MPAGRLGGVRPCKQRSPPFPLSLTKPSPHSTSQPGVCLAQRRHSTSGQGNSLCAGDMFYMFAVPCDGSILEPIWPRGGLLPPSPGLSLPCTPAPALCLGFNLNGRDRKPMFQLLVLRWGRSPRERSGETPVPASGHSCPGKVRGEGSEVAGQTDNNQTFCQAWWEWGYDHNRGARIKPNQLRDQPVVWAVSCWQRWPQVHRILTSTATGSGFPWVTMTRGDHAGRDAQAQAASPPHHLPTRSLPSLPSSAGRAMGTQLIHHQNKTWIKGEALRPAVCTGSFCRETKQQT